uniref:Uncharacterized protein n=1 Tax=Glossina brevipalpis TaxID=37001 RepID=A0A1A9W093_9MUSC
MTKFVYECLGPPKKLYSRTILNIVAKFAMNTSQEYLGSQRQIVLLVFTRPTGRSEAIKEESKIFSSWVVLILDSRKYVTFKTCSRIWKLDSRWFSTLLLQQPHFYFSASFVGFTLLLLLLLLLYYFEAKVSHQDAVYQLSQVLASSPIQT